MKVKEAEENNLGSRSDTRQWGQEGETRQWGQEGEIGGSELPGLGDSGKNPP